MISKEEFVSILNEMKDIRDKVNKAEEILKEFNINNLPVTSHEYMVVRLLEIMFNDSSTIQYWIYDLNYGRDYTEGCIKYNDSIIIDISTADKLYDYLVESKGE